MNDAPPGRPALPALLGSVAAPAVWLLQFVALQALLGMGCGRVDTATLQWAAVASGALGALALAVLAWRSQQARAAAGVALAGVGWSTLAALWLAPCPAAA